MQLVEPGGAVKTMLGDGQWFKALDGESRDEMVAARVRAELGWSEVAA